VQALIMEAACPERAQALADVLPQYVNLARARVMVLTPVIGAHIGVGTLGIACCPVDVCPVAPDEG
jgi:fatty acid-binding protein DegV